MNPFVSYSQYGEDTIINELLKDESAACLDIGAWDAEMFSNTRALIKRGWSAVLIEPSPGPVRRLVDFYRGCESSVQVIAAAVVPEGAGLIRLRVTDDAVSSSQQDVQAIWDKEGGYYGYLWVPCLAVSDILNQFGGFQFVNIDAEGMSVAIAKAYLQRAQPQVMCVEHDNRLIELLQEAQKHGYRAVHTNGCNVVLAK